MISCSEKKTTQAAAYTVKHIALPTDNAVSRALQQVHAFCPMWYLYLWERACVWVCIDYTQSALVLTLRLMPMSSVILVVTKYYRICCHSSLRYLLFAIVLCFVLVSRRDEFRNFIHFLQLLTTYTTVNAKRRMCPYVLYLYIIYALILWLAICVSVCVKVSVMMCVSNTRSCSMLFCRIGGFLVTRPLQCVLFKLACIPEHIYHMRHTQVSSCRDCRVVPWWSTLDQLDRIFLVHAQEGMTGPL